MAEEMSSEKEAVRLIYERFRAQRSGIDAAKRKANVWFDDEGGQVAERVALSRTGEWENARDTDRKL